MKRCPNDNCQCQDPNCDLAGCLYLVEDPQPPADTPSLTIRQVSSEEFASMADEVADFVHPTLENDEPDAPSPRPIVAYHAFVGGNVDSRCMICTQPQSDIKHRGPYADRAPSPGAQKALPLSDVAIDAIRKGEGVYANLQLLCNQASTANRLQAALEHERQCARTYRKHLHETNSALEATERKLREAEAWKRKQADDIMTLGQEVGRLTAALARAREEETRACIEALKKRGDGAYSEARRGVFHEAAGTLAERLPSPTSEKADSHD